PFYNNPGISDWLGAGDAIRSQAGVTIAALTHLAVGLWALSELRRGAQGRLLDRGPRLADRSRGLWGERGGRIDKLDLLIMAVLLVGVLTLRLFRLSDPYEFHFDEVYHARTAMEFLQDWRYGMPHDIYEFTHPHLAKYAMAEG